MRESFSISSKRDIVLSKKKKKRTSLADVKIFDTEEIFTRIMCFIVLKQIELETTLNYELAPNLTALFQDNREMRYPKAKSVLKRTLEVTASGRVKLYPTALIIDGSTIFGTMNWSNQGTVADLQPKYSSINKQID